MVEFMNIFAGAFVHYMVLKLKNKYILFLFFQAQLYSTQYYVVDYIQYISDCLSFCGFVHRKLADCWDPACGHRRA